MQRIINSKGSTFVTTLVSTLVFMVIAMSLISSIEDSFKASNFNSAKINEMAGMANLKIHMANLATCQKNLKDKSLSSAGETTLPNILDASGNALFAIGQTTAKGSLYVTDIKLKNPSGDPIAAIGGSPIPAKGFSLPTRIEVSLRKEKISFGSKVYTATIDLPVLIDGSAKILDCDVTAPAFDLSGLCKQVGGTLDSATSTCIYPTDCTEKDPAKLATGKCLKDDVASIKKTIEEVQTALASPTPGATPAPTPGTPAQEQAWAGSKERVGKCLETGATVGADKIYCGNAGFFVDLRPTTGQVGSAVYSDPAVAEFVFKKTQELVKARFGYK